MEASEKNENFQKEQRVQEGIRGAASRKSRDIGKSGSDVSHHIVGLATSGLVKVAGEQRRMYVNTSELPIGQSLIKITSQDPATPRESWKGL